MQRKKGIDPKNVVKATIPQTKVYFSNRKMWNIPQNEYQLEGRSNNG